MKRSSSPDLLSSPDILDPKAKPPMEPISPSNKLVPRAENSIQVAERTPPSAFQILMSGKRTLPWLASPPDGMYMIRHKVGGTQDIPQISFEVVGSTGNIYKTVIGKLPTCDCPDVRFRKTQCKHICFVLSAMDVPEQLMYQRSFLPSELRAMLAVLSLKRNLDRTTLASAGERKPVEGQCPICFHGFETDQKTTWCQSCGSNFHRACFKKWEAAMRTFHTVVNCLHCNAPWQTDEHGTPHLNREVIQTKGDHNRGGYVNMGGK
ncbi:hypothetical protein N7489_010396 [Penicillium chrysogenum]|uniref:uncharacterized protein n=1 Tax=Penicillium chrysogenum TaxID=5076 RepID=UPI0023831D6D|nr:uncharacterized protein N7489_010396 [Penicillium chrysogenum]KAJ5229688.1 hypothetical protein N7489_010396 [Penicillium chrysogenum]KAJ5259092.1 hypothetical protein N7524_010648 [Penicillium chrysogenum]KAJ6169567.1 hypothetical protein N7497_002410 [Penicillium chrysogenum]